MDGLITTLRNLKEEYNEISRRDAPLALSLIQEQYDKLCEVILERMELRNKENIKFLKDGLQTTLHENTNKPISRHVLQRACKNFVGRLAFDPTPECYKEGDWYLTPDKMCYCLYNGDWHLVLYSPEAGPIYTDIKKSSSLPSCHISKCKRYVGAGTNYTLLKDGDWLRINGGQLVCYFNSDWHRVE